MKRLGIRAAALGMFVLMGLAAGVGPAAAQIPPLPQPSIPPEAQPVLEVLAPTIYPQCGTATLVVFLFGSSVAPAISPELAPLGYQATGPVFAVCGAVPRPPVQYTCLLDRQVQEAINAVTLQAGAAVPLGLHPQGDVVEQTILVVDRLPPPASTSGLQAILPPLLVCAVPASSTPEQGDYSTQPGGLTPPPSYTPPASTPGSLPGALASPVTSPVPPVLSQQPPARTPVGDAVRYAAVWLLPLGLLLFGGYFGGAFTRDIQLGAPVCV